MVAKFVHVTLNERAALRKQKHLVYKADLFLFTSYPVAKEIDLSYMCTIMSRFLVAFALCRAGESVISFRLRTLSTTLFIGSECWNHCAGQKKV